VGEAPPPGPTPDTHTTLTLVELRVCELLVSGGGGGAPPGLAQATPGLWGCRSWVDLPPARADGFFTLGRPVLDDAAWAAAQARLRRGVVGHGGLPPGVCVEEVGVLG
jgi:hypothetical protein